MPDDIFVVNAPQLGVNDQVATIVKWYVRDEDAVSTGEVLCALETAKALFDVEAEATGYIVHLVDVGSEVKISQAIALIGPRLETLEQERKQYTKRVRREEDTWQEVGETVKATRKARDTAQELGVDLTEIPIKGIIREGEVIQYHEGSSVGQRKSVTELSWDSAKEPIIIYGAGKGAVTLKQCLDFNEARQVVCFVDDDRTHSDTLCELPVYHSSRLPEIVKEGVKSLVSEIADGSIRLRIWRQCQSLGLDLINVIHPEAYVAPTVRLGVGNYIKAGAIIETNTVIENCCILDNNATIAHDNVIGDCCHIAPGVSMGSSVHVGELTVVGIGASVATGVRIGRSCIISVGSSVVKDVPDYAVIEGVAGRVIGIRKKPVG